MARTVQVRDVPDRVHRRLVEQAEFEGLSLSDYLRREFERTAALPSMAEFMAEITSHPPVPDLDATAEVRAIRDEYEE